MRVPRKGPVLLLLPVAAAVALACGTASPPPAATPTSTPTPSPRPSSPATLVVQEPVPRIASETLASSPGIDTESLVEITPLIAPDPDLSADDVERQRLLFSGWGFYGYLWKTDFSRHTVPYDEIMVNLQRDNIRPIYEPKFETVFSAVDWLLDTEPLIVVEVNGKAKAYPQRILLWHEVVNDVIGGRPIAVTWCPLCNTAIVFDRQINSRIFTFGVSGLLRNSNVIMWDHETESL